MMDRNTLTALLLITLVLVLTPYYMELVSPAPQPEYEDTNGVYEDTDEVVVDNSYNTLPKDNKTNKAPHPLLDLVSQAPTEDKTIVIESDLYIAKLGSAAGGSVLSYKIKEHLSPDSAYVDLVTTENRNNLLISFRGVDGEIINLQRGWVQQDAPDSAYLINPETISYTNRIGEKTITKTITLYPDDFIMDIEIDVSSMSDDILGGGFLFSWLGGLPTTEKDTITEKTYFGAYLHQGGELLDIKAGSGESFKNEYKGQTDWVAIRTKYFVTALLDNGSNQIMGSTISASNTTKELYDIAIELPTNQKVDVSLYLGPLEYDRVKNLNANLESIMNFGWTIIRPISKGVLWTLKSMHRYIPNYGIILIIFSIMVKLLVYPLTKKSYQSTTAMQALQPEINNLKEKYKNNPTKLNQATMELYKKKGVNPLGSCLPMLLQMPLLIALFTVFRSTIELRGEPFVFWIKDLSAPDIIFNLPFKIPIYGDYVCALPIIMALSMYAQQKMMTVEGANQEQQKLMQYFMMGFFFLLFNSFPSGLNLYYTLFNVLTIAQQKLTGSRQAEVQPKS
jgi:YidC/Oxa1 family membrane protein insertase